MTLYRKIFGLVFLFAALNASGQTDARIVKLNDVLKLASEPTDKIQVINFWATWCAPCVKELPLFQKLEKDDSSVNVTLVSMDMDLDPDPSKVYKFIQRKNLKSRVWLLDEKDPNVYIDQIEKEWSGALPATIIVNTRTGERKFIGQELHEGELEKFIAEIR